MFEPWVLVFSCLKETAVFLAHLPSLLKRSRTLFVHASNVSLNVLDVELEVLFDEVAELFGGIRIARDEWSCWHDTRLGVSAPHQAPTNYRSIPGFGHTQPEVSQTPYFLE